MFATLIRVWHENDRVQWIHPDLVVSLVFLDEDMPCPEIIEDTPGSKFAITYIDPADEDPVQKGYTTIRELDNGDIDTAIPDEATLPMAKVEDILARDTIGGLKRALEQFEHEEDDTRS